MKVHRSHPEGGFVQVPNDTARDDRLSYHARGILAEMLSRPDGWHESADAITARGREARGTGAEGRRATRAAMAELEAAGYLRRVKLRGPRGQWTTEVHVSDVPDGGMSARPAQTHVSPGGAEVPPADTSASGTSYRRRVTEHGIENGSSSPGSAGAEPGPAHEPPHEQDPHRKAVEQIIAGYLGRRFGHEHVATLEWTQRLHKSHLHRDPEMFTRYLARLYRAAPDEMGELAIMHQDGNDHAFQDNVAEPLRQARTAAKRHQLSKQDEEACARVTAWAEQTYEQVWDGEPLTGRAAVRIGVDQAEREMAGRRGQT